MTGELRMVMADAVAASLHNSVVVLDEIAHKEQAPRPRWHVEIRYLDGSIKAFDIEELKELHRRVARYVNFYLIDHIGITLNKPHPSIACAA
jgi:hypothetical protein